MQYSQEHLKTMVYAEFGGQTECIIGNQKIENYRIYCQLKIFPTHQFLSFFHSFNLFFFSCNTAITFAPFTQIMFVGKNCFSLFHLENFVYFQIIFTVDPDMNLFMVQSSNNQSFSQGHPTTIFGKISVRKTI